MVRFAECNRSCSWCDEPLPTLDKKSVSTDVCEDPESLVCVLHNHTRMFPFSVTFTGGEPLLYEPFIRKFAFRWNHISKIYLETNGDLLDTENLHLFSGVTVSPKLSSSGKSFSRYLNLIEIEKEAKRSKIDLCIKWVVANELDYKELIYLLEAHSFDSPLYLQPAYGMLSFEDLWELFINEPIRGVKVLPQVHKFLREPTNLITRRAE